jgi:hypothetical protein
VRTKKQKNEVLDDVGTVAEIPLDTPYVLLNGVKMGDWAGWTPCCKENVVVGLKHVDIGGPDWYYRKCKGCGALVEIRCSLAKDRHVDVAVGMASARALAGNAPLFNLQNQAIAKAGGVKNRLVGTV